MRQHCDFIFQSYDRRRPPELFPNIPVLEGCVDRAALARDRVTMLLQSDGRLPSRIAPPPSPKAHAQKMTNGITGAIQGRVWSGVGVAIGLLIVVVAGATLFRLLREIDLDEVVAALRAKAIWEVVIAGGFVLAGYVTLTFYDFFALRTIGSLRWRASPATRSATISARPSSPAGRSDFGSIPPGAWASSMSPRSP